MGRWSGCVGWWEPWQWISSGSGQCGLGEDQSGAAVVPFPARSFSPSSQGHLTEVTTAFSFPAL